ncbi:alpha/beta fold hydrolase [bacterium]|nr:alpha/beta fold hydrolase [bacterium]
MTSSREPSEHTLTTRDGTALFYRAWLPVARADRPIDRALLLFHRGHEHSGRWHDVVAALGFDDVAVFAWDARGHGRSPGERGAADSLAVLVEDVDDFVRALTERHRIPVENMVVLAHSVGAVVVAAWVHDYAPPIRGLILATPAFRVKLYVPFAVPLLRLRQALLGSGYVKSYVKARMLTHDAVEAERYRQDALVFRQIAVNILLDLHDTSTRLLRDAGAIHAPTLILGAGADWVVSLRAQRRFFDGLASPIKELHVFPGFYHAIFHERDRHLPIQRARAFIHDRFQHPPVRPSLLAADANGPSRAAYERLREGRGARFLPAAWAMKTVGRLSDGIRLGWRAGFDSGVMLDYVYEHRPRGLTPLGRLIDRAYLNSIGWRGIRQRKAHLEQLLRAAVGRVHAEGRPIRLLDIASGPGRYLLETIDALAPLPVTALLRDDKTENVAAGRELARQLGLETVTFAQGDAFDRGALAAVRPRPTIAIVSGLYELFPENEGVLASLQGVADALEPGGYLIYTNQPYHPQLDFIARALINREGRPWVMRCRAQAEMDQLVAAAGFEKIRMAIDRWGIFTVSLARRREG